MKDLSAKIKSFCKEARANGLDVLDWLLMGSFPQQEEFCRSEARWRSLMCPRRAGKSVAAAICAIATAWRHPECTVLITGLSKESAARSFEDALDRLLGLLPHKKLLPVVKSASLLYRFPNRSKIVVQGAAASGKSRISRFRGTAYKLVICDEPQDWPNDLLWDFVNAAVGPALIDHEGKMILCGTPGHGQTYWWQIAANTNNESTGDGKRWQRFVWTLFDNKHNERQARKEVAEMLATDPEYTQKSDYKREYEGAWPTEDESLRIFTVDRKLNYCPADQQPAWDKMKPWDFKTLLGIDFGYIDATAYVVVRYCVSDPTLYVVHIEDYQYLLFDDILEHARRIMKDWSVVAWVGDSGGGHKTTVESLKAKLDYVENIKVDKSDVRRDKCTIASELKKSKIKLVGSAYDTMAEEWKRIIWEPELYKQGKLVEQELQGKHKAPNHRSDALRYVWGASKHFMGKAREQKHAPSVDREVELVKALVEQSRKKKRGTSELERLRALG